MITRAEQGYQTIARKQISELLPPFRLNTIIMMGAELLYGQDYCVGMTIVWARLLWGQDYDGGNTLMGARLLCAGHVVNTKVFSWETSFGEVDSNS
jgi:hypothetical protein